MKIKNVLTVLLFLILLISCTKKEPTRDEIVKNNVEQYLMDKLDDPDSYEFVEISLRDSTLYKENIVMEIDNWKSSLQFDKDQLERQERYKEELPYLFNEEDYENYKAKVKKDELIIKKIDSLKEALGARVNDVAAYSFFFKFRANNKLGAKTLHAFVVQTKMGPDYDLINFTNEKEKIILNPNRYPGYEEIINYIK